MFTYRYSTLRGGGTKSLYIRGRRSAIFDKLEASEDPIWMAQEQSCLSGEESCCPNEPLFESVIHNPWREGDLESVSSFQTDRSSVSGRSKKLKNQSLSKNKYEVMEYFFREYIFSPPQLLIDQTIWTTHPVLKMVGADDKQLDLCFKNWRVELASWDYSDFVQFYKAKRHYYFKPKTEYHSVEQSVYWAEKWLENNAKNGYYFQPLPAAARTVKRASSVQEWLQVISDVLNRRYKKLRTVQFNGPRSVGKSWFTDMFADFYLNRADLSNWNRYVNSTFPFGDLDARRLILWNEPALSGDETQIEDLKKLMGGEILSANKKYARNQAKVYNTPMIITCNHGLLDNDPIFLERRRIFECVPFPEFIGGQNCPGQKALHPFAWIKLLKKYNIETDVVTVQDDNCKSADIVFQYESD
mgnify:CR=1 FL=1